MFPSPWSVEETLMTNSSKLASILVGKSAYAVVADLSVAPLPIGRFAA
jgi:hypothetical protein